MREGEVLVAAIRDNPGRGYLFDKEPPLNPHTTVTVAESRSHNKPQKKGRLAATSQIRHLGRGGVITRVTLVPRHHVPLPSTITYGKAGKALFGAMESRRKFHIYHGIYSCEYVSEFSSVSLNDVCHTENIWISIVFMIITRVYQVLLDQVLFHFVIYPESKNNV